MSINVLMTGRLDFNDAHTHWVSACRKLCLTTCLLTSIVQVMEAYGIVADLLITMHSSVLHPIGKATHLVSPVLCRQDTCKEGQES